MTYGAASLTVPSLSAGVIGIVYEMEPDAAGAAEVATKRARTHRASAVLAILAPVKLTEFVAWSVFLARRVDQLSGKEACRVGEFPKVALRQSTSRRLQAHLFRNQREMMVYTWRSFFCKRGPPRPGPQ